MADYAYAFKASPTHPYYQPPAIQWRPPSVGPVSPGAGGGSAGDEASDGGDRCRVPVIPVQKHSKNVKFFPCN
ncbi:hypothetical protein C8F01DRAFT_1263489 [Mycena amicta]|nr:hypothetical protein C8F01DRAFT_1263489 [Mycena amicta]